MPPTTYADVLVRNIRAARSRLGLDQANVVARMRALGYETWHRQTMGKVERAERRISAEEVVGLAYALETSISALMSASHDDEAVSFPSGAAVSAGSVYRSAQGSNDGELRWQGDVPVFAGVVGAKPPWPPPGSVMYAGNADTLRRLAELEERLAEYERQPTEPSEAQ